MTEAEWLGCSDLEQMLSALPVSLRVHYRKLRLYACACCRLVPAFLNSEPDRKCLELAENEADGLDLGREFPVETWGIGWHTRDGSESVQQAIASFRAEMWNASELRHADESKRADVLQ